MSTTQRKQIESLEVSYRQFGQNWSDDSLVQHFLSEVDSQDCEEGWYLARWNPGPPQSGGLVVRLYCPEREAEGETFRTLLETLHFKLTNGLTLSSRDKGWPPPRFTVQVFRQDSEETWAYQLVLGPFQTEPFELHPNKILAVGEEGALSSLLGLEAVDPVFGLPAKWVTFGQSEKASQHGCLLFEATEVVMGHAINFLGSRMEHALGLWEINQWFSASLTHRGMDACQLLEDAAYLLRLVRRMVSEGLHLPAAERFCEHLLVAQAETDDLDEIEMLVRKEVVNDNVSLWLDEDGMLNAIEWKGPEELQSTQHLRMLERLTRATEQVTSKTTSGRPVLLVNVEEGRSELATAIKGLFPDLPVLAWSDLKDLSNIQVLVSVNATLTVDPSAVPVAFFSTMT